MKPCEFIRILIVIMVILSPSLSSAVPQEDKIDSEHLTIEDGLSQSSVFAILQDNRGMMWFGTWDGLNRYDGYRFTIYKYDPHNPQSLSNNEIRALHEDSQGVHWVGTMKGLNRSDREKESFIRYTHNPNNPASLAGNRVHAIADDQERLFWWHQVLRTGLGSSGENLDRETSREDQITRREQ